jgi:hypothetical protein
VRYYIVSVWMWFVFGPYTQILSPILLWVVTFSERKNSAWISAFILIISQFILVIFSRCMDFSKRHREEKITRWIARLVIGLRMFFLSLLLGLLCGWLSHSITTLTYHDRLSTQSTIGRFFMFGPMSLFSMISLLFVVLLSWRKKLLSLKVSVAMDIAFLLLTLTSMGMIALFSYLRHPSFNAITGI